MRFSTSVRLASVLVAPLIVSAAPLKRTVDAGTMEVLAFATVLENLETEFYKQGLAKFQSSDFSNAGFTSGDGAVAEITIIQIDEDTHFTTLESVITSFGGTPVKGCSFDFTSVLTDVSTMVSTARLVEHVGVGAYLGAAHLVGDQDVLTAAASILTVEARHGTLLNMMNGATAISEPFDIPLAPPEVLAIAGGFIKGCSLGITPNPSLTITNTEVVTAGTTLTFSSSAISGNTENFYCQMLAGGLPFSLSLPLSQCVVPEGLNGAVAIWITSDNQPLNGNVIERQSNAIVAGPTMTFVDVNIDEISILIRNKGSSGSNNSGNSSSNSSGNSSNSSNSSSSSSNPNINSNSSLTSSFASTTTVSPSDAAAIIGSLPVSTLAPTATPSATGPANVIANGVSMVPKPTS
jgi:hypothetical protein